jgi:hypothetical protein
MSAEKFSDQEIRRNIKRYLHHYFSEAKEMAQCNIDFIEANRLEIPNVNYYILKRFVDTAIKNFENHDYTIKNGLLGKIYNDVSRLQTFFLDFKAHNQYEKIVLEQRFLPTFSLYKEMERKIDKLKRLRNLHQRVIRTTENELKFLPKPTTEEGIAKHKKLKRRQVDAIDEHANVAERLERLQTKQKAFAKRIEKHFLRLFVNQRDAIVQDFMTIINVKTYYMDLLLWKKSSESEKIRTFFEEARIQGDFTIKTFLNYYMKNIDMEKTHNTEWHNYLQECLIMLK